MSKEPLYPHIPKGKGNKPQYPHNPEYKTPPSSSGAGTEHEATEGSESGLLKFYMKLRQDRDATMADIFLKAQIMGGVYGEVVDSGPEGYSALTYIDLFNSVLTSNEFVQYVNKVGYEVLSERQVWYVKYHLSRKSFIGPNDKTLELGGATVSPQKYIVSDDYLDEDKEEGWWRIGVFDNEQAASDFKNWLQQNNYISKPIINAWAVNVGSIVYRE